MKTKLILVLGACVLLGMTTIGQAQATGEAKPAAKKKTEAKGNDAHPSASDFECAWTGKRVVSLLTRDDVDAATHFARFYSSFNCPNPHIGKTLGCVVAPESMGDGEPIESRIERCWTDPKSKPFPPAGFQARAAKDAKDKAAKDRDKDSKSPEPANGAKATGERR